MRINAVEAEVGTFLDGLLERLPLGRSRLDALASSGLFVLDAVIDPDEPSPLGRRFQSLGDEVGSAVEVAGASSGGSAAKRDMIHSDGAFGLCLTKADDANV